jgi:hypothetical protein
MLEERRRNRAAVREMHLVYEAAAARAAAARGQVKHDDAGAASRNSVQDGVQPPFSEKRRVC